MFRKFLKWLQGDWWQVRSCGFPYDDGYSTYNPARKTILDTGLTRKQAQAICDRLNTTKETPDANA